MTRDRWALLLIIAAGAVLVAGLTLVLWVAVAGRDAASAPSATPTRFATITPSPSPTPSASPTPVPTAVTATCETTITDAFRAAAAARGWVSVETTAEPGGTRPFDEFYNGAPDGQLICRWGAAPDAANGPPITLAWASIDPENAVSAIGTLEGEGFTRTDAPEGVYLDSATGGSYLFTLADVRWAPSRADLADIAEPH